MSLFAGVELTPEQQAAVQANADKHYEGWESQEAIAKLKANGEALLAEKKESQRLAKEASDKTDQAKLDALAKGNDFEAYKSSVDAKLKESKDMYEALIQKNEAGALDKMAQKIATALSGENAEAMYLNVKARLKINEGSVMVTDAQGNLSATSPAELEAEFRNNPIFAGSIIGTRADGGGAANNSNGSGGAGSSSKSFSEMTVKERTEYLTNKP